MVNPFTKKANISSNVLYFDLTFSTDAKLFDDSETENIVQDLCFAIFGQLKMHLRWRIRK